MHSSLLGPALFALATLAAPAFAAETFVALIEAENRELNRASIESIPSPDASAGAYANHSSAYNPLFSGDWPAKEAERLTVWARVRGHPVQLKVFDAAGKQTELPWEWACPPAWRWVSLGTHDRSALGVGFIIIRSVEAPAEAGLDALIVTNDPNFRPLDAKP